MDITRIHINLFFSIIASNIVALLGGWDFSLKFLIMLVIFDYCTGILKAAYQRNLSSSIGYWGIFKKLCIFIVIAIASQIDKSGIQNEPLIRTYVIWFYISNEGISISENLTALGVPIPQSIRNRLSNFNRTDGE